MHRYVEEGRQFIQDAIDMEEDERDTLEDEIYRIYEMGRLDVLEEEFLYIVEDSYYEDDFDSTIEESLEQAVINAEEAIRAEDGDDPFDALTEGNSHQAFCR